MGFKVLAMAVAGCSAMSLAQAMCKAQTLIDSNFSQGDFHSLGWKIKGDWDLFRYPDKAASNPGRVARFPANKPEGSLTREFPEIKNPKDLRLSIDYGWGWGDAGQAADSISFMLLDPRGNGYIFEVHRCKARWAVQWGLVDDGKPRDRRNWAADEIDATHTAVRDGGGLSRLLIEREDDGTWVFSSKDWNQEAGAALRFNDCTTTSFSQLVLFGNKNFDDQLFNKIVLTTTGKDPVATTARPTSDFLNSIGVDTTFPDRGQPLAKTVEMIKYCGFRWVRGGIEGLTENGPTTIETYLDLHRQTGVRFSWGLGSGGADLTKLVNSARTIAAAGSLLAFEGNNEPNNWDIVYEGKRGGGHAPSWLAVAKLQRDLYHAVKSDSLLKNYPVWSISENGAELDNVGLQYLTIPTGAGALLPDGTKYADFANCHNYIYHAGSPGLSDNATWNAADPTSICKVDGLFGNYGRTWARHYRGYSENELLTLPKVTTETGCQVGGGVGEEIHALNLLSLYLDQFKRGWTYTSVYILRDRTDEAGNQQFGFYRSDYMPRKAAVYLHNLTTILADNGTERKKNQLAYSIPEKPVAVHDMLLENSDGAFHLVIWGERLNGEDRVTIRFSSTQSSAAIYDPTLGTQPIRKLSGVDSFEVTLSNHPLVIALPSRAK